jgi:hypothetical protein
MMVVAARRQTAAILESGERRSAETPLRRSKYGIELRFGGFVAK